MNEITKSVLRRVGWVTDTAKIRHVPIEGEIEISEEELKCLSWDMLKWAKTYDIKVDGIKLKVQWTT